MKNLTIACVKLLGRLFLGNRPSIHDFVNLDLVIKRLNDENRCSRPISAATEENVARARELIREDVRISMKDIKNSLKIGSSALDVIHHQHLGVTKRCARWVPHQLTQ